MDLKLEVVSFSSSIWTIILRYGFAVICTYAIIEANAIMEADVKTNRLI